MPAALVKMYESLDEQQQQQAYNFIFSLYQKNAKSTVVAEKNVDAFGMWKDRDDCTDVNSFAENLRRGRSFGN